MRSSDDDEGEEIYMSIAHTRLSSMSSDSGSCSSISRVLGAPRGRGVRSGPSARMVQCGVAAWRTPFGTKWGQFSTNVYS